MAFECSRVLDANKKDEGYFLIPDTKLQSQQQKLLPTFLNEVHVPGVESGSAPKETIYWFGNILVYLMSRLDLVDVEEAAVAEVVKIGLNKGLKGFNAMVFSILDFVLIQVAVDKDGTVHVKRLALMILCPFSNSNSGYAHGPRSRSVWENTDSEKVNSKAVDTTVIDNEDVDIDIDDPDTDDLAQVAEAEDPDAEDLEAENPEAENPEDEVSDDEDSDDDDPENEDPGTEDPEAEDSDNDEPETRMAYNSFIALTHFFNAAGNQSFKGTKSSKLPNEGLSMIMQYSVMQTYHSLANVSSCCREMACNRFRLNDYYAVIGINQKPKRLILEDIYMLRKED